MPTSNQPHSFVPCGLIPPIEPGHERCHLAGCHFPASDLIHQVPTLLTQDEIQAERSKRAYQSESAHPTIHQPRSIPQDYSFTLEFPREPTVHPFARQIAEALLNGTATLGVQVKPDDEREAKERAFRDSGRALIEALDFGPIDNAGHCLYCGDHEPSHKPDCPYQNFVSAFTALQPEELATEATEEKK